MTRRKVKALLVRLLGASAATVLMACLILPLTAPRAAACDVSISYRPSISISLSKPGLGLSKPCSSGNSLTGVAIVAVLALGTLAAAGTVAFRRGETAAGASPSHPRADPGETLAAYLNATGITASTPTAPKHGAGDGGPRITS